MSRFKPETRSVGNLKEWTKQHGGIILYTSDALVRVQLFLASVIRITCITKQQFEDFSYAVTAQPETVDFSVTEDENLIYLRTPALTINIRKQNLGFAFLTPAQQVINEDDPLGTCWNGEQVTTYKKLQPGERFVGLGEKTGPLDRKGSGYQHWNTDAYGYHAGSDPLYCSTPFYIGIHNSLCYGIYFDNTHKSFFNFGASNNRFASFSADQGEMDYYFIHGTTVADIIRQYTHLTGRMHLPPKWSLGYQQCRYSYYPDKEVLNVANTFRDKNIPCDVIVLDIHYMNKYKIFTWDKKHFPDPKSMLQQLENLGFHVVVMCDPGIKVEEGYKTYDDGIKQDVYLKYPDGTNYTGQVWPGWCHFPDFTNPATRSWWMNQLKAYTDLGIDGFWNDMNEIATWGHMLPENIELDFEGNKATMRRGRNIYGLMMARSTYEGVVKLLDGKRPFNLTRSGFSGIQRYAAVWTGDNVAYDEHMMLGVRLVNSMGLTGIAFAGYDVGGFVGNADIRLFTRWLTIGSFSPFFRGHSMINSRDTEPWTYGEEAEQICRNYIRFRYRIMPYIYSAFYEAAQTGMPVQRSLAIDYTHDPKIYDHRYHHQYLFGPFMLIAPVESTKDITRVYLPEGNWYSLYDGKQFTGSQEFLIECPIHRLPVFIKEGAIIAMQEPGFNTVSQSDTLDLHIYYTANTSSYCLYWDDGHTFDYKQGNFSLWKIELNGLEKRITIEKRPHQFAEGIRLLKIVMHGFPQINEAHINGQFQSVNQTINRFFEPLEKYDPITDPEPAPEEPVTIIAFENNADTFIISW
ncbi:MAG: glycoside hydrolase family 31 protein [Cyclobacteriaceae bacterium]|nr:glycoside hydrolase family 31 protein [Cyclobacteriaceae bacterium]